MQNGKLLYEAGKKAYSYDQWNEAIEYFEEASQSISDEFVWFYLGSCYAEINKHQKAIEAYDKSYAHLSKGESINNKITVLLSKVNEHQKLNQFKEAREVIEIAKKVIEKSHSNESEKIKFDVEKAERTTKRMEEEKHFTDLDKEAKNLEKKKSYKEAIAHFTLILKEYNEPDIYFRRGKCFQELHCYAEAINDYIDSQKHESKANIYKNIEAMYNQGVCLQEIGRLEEALKKLTEASKEIKYHQNQELKEKVNTTLKQLENRTNVLLIN